MGSVLAIVSKAIFEREARGLKLGAVWDTNKYSSKQKKLHALDGGGDLFLVTVRPPEQLWLVARLVEPEFDGEGWAARANELAAVEITDLVSQLEFTGGKPINTEAGKLGMSLQTPRELSEVGEAMLRDAAALGQVAGSPAAEAVEEEADDAPERVLPPCPVELDLAADKVSKRDNGALVKWIKKIRDLPKPRLSTGLPLRFSNPRWPRFVDQLDEAEQWQMVAMGVDGYGMGLTPAAWFAQEEESKFLPFELWDVLDAEGYLAYRMWLYNVDSATILESDTVEVMGGMSQSYLHCEQEGLQQAILEARDAVPARVLASSALKLIRG